ncbi:MAG: hypothetical protein HC875_16580 [Anaerolineales bacterium]|nr:hypothetical protein [Anaerolineales bacterium]
MSQPGRHQVSLTYQPESARWGSWISLISAGFLLVAAGGVLLTGKAK